MQQLRRRTQSEKIDSEHTIQDLEVARSALNQLLTSKAETSVLFARQRLYEHVNKP